MQLRDDIPRIFYPGHWGCFGGAVGAGEDGLVALQRELAEELEMLASAASEFVKFDFDLSKLGQKRCYRTYYEIGSPKRRSIGFVLHEGAEMRLISRRGIIRSAADTLRLVRAVAAFRSRSVGIGDK